jgi:putative adenylate-forming enzyme
VDLSMIARVLWFRRRLRRRERWSESELRRHQRSELEVLRRFAVSRSPFYRTFYRGLDRAPLAELPPLSKATLMDNFDQISTQPTVRLADLQTYLDALTDNRPFRGRYWVSATSGSSGRKSVIASSADEWAKIIASYGRANEWAGISPGLGHRVSLAVVSSTKPWHQSSRVAATVRSPLVLSEGLDAASPVSEIVGRLNQLHPDVLVAYASMIRVLADEQLAGRLRIAPRAVNSSSEVLTTEARAMATRAWHVPVFNVYAATETGGIAAECSQHLGMHLFEDLVIPEIVDDQYRPVPAGEPGDRLLVTVLSSRTIPLIRYELTDRLQLSTRRCPCGLPFSLVDAVEGRTDDVLSLPGQRGGLVQVHPVVFHQTLDLLDAAGWQIQQQKGGLRILVAGPGQNFHKEATETNVQAALTAAGTATLELTVTVVDGIPAGAAGKRPLVVALPSSTPRGGG